MMVAGVEDEVDDTHFFLYEVYTRYMIVGP